MPPQLLPASAAAFAPRASQVTVVLGSQVEAWLTRTLKKVNRTRRPLNNPLQHQNCLVDILSSKNALWLLASIILPAKPRSQLHEPPRTLEELRSNYSMHHIKAYIVSVDMVLNHQVAFKLTPETINALVRYHKTVHCVNEKASTPDYNAKAKNCNKLHEHFITAINSFVYHTHVSVLEDLEEEGAGELPSVCAEEVKQKILELMKPLVYTPRQSSRMKQSRAQSSKKGLATKWKQVQQLQQQQQQSHEQNIREQQKSPVARVASVPVSSVQSSPDRTIAATPIVSGTYQQALYALPSTTLAPEFTYQGYPSSSTAESSFGIMDLTNLPTMDMTASAPASLYSVSPSMGAANQTPSPVIPSCQDAFSHTTQAMSASNPLFTDWSSPPMSMPTPVLDAWNPAEQSSPVVAQSYMDSVPSQFWSSSASQNMASFGLNAFNMNANNQLPMQPFLESFSESSMTTAEVDALATTITSMPMSENFFAMARQPQQEQQQQQQQQPISTTTLSSTLSTFMYPDLPMYLGGSCGLGLAFPSSWDQTPPEVTPTM